MLVLKLCVELTADRVWRRVHEGHGRGRKADGGGGEAAGNRDVEIGGAASIRVSIETVGVRVGIGRLLCVQMLLRYLEMVRCPLLHRRGPRREELKPSVRREPARCQIALKDNFQFSLPAIEAKNMPT